MTGLTQVEVQNLISRGVIIPPKPCNPNMDPKRAEYMKEYRKRTRDRVNELALIRYHKNKKKEMA